MLHYKHEFKYNYGQITKTNTTTNTRYGNYSNRLMTADSLQIYNPFKCTNGVCIEVRNILFHSSPFIIENCICSQYLLHFC